MLTAILANPLYKLMLQIGGVLSILAIIYIGVKIHDSNIKSLALQEFNKTQLEETIRNQKDYIEKLKKIEELQITISKDMTTQKSKLDASLTDIEAYLADPKTKSISKQVSPIIKHTINKLREQE